MRKKKYREELNPVKKHRTKETFKGRKKVNIPNIAYQNQHININIPNIAYQNQYIDIVIRHGSKDCVIVLDTVKTTFNLI